MTPSSAVVAEGLRRLDWSAADLWVAAVGVGGNLSRREIAAIADGTRAASPEEHDVLVAALNDQFVGLGRDHPLTYWADTPSTER